MGRPGVYKQVVSDVRDLVAEILLALETEGERVRDGLDRVRDSVADARDRSLLTELCYGVVRRQGTLDALLARASRRPLQQLDAAARVGLRLGLYPALFLTRIPDHASVHHAVSWVRGHAGTGAAGYVNGVLRTLLRARAGEALGREDAERDVPREDGSALRFREPMFASPESDLLRNVAARFSCPKWLCARWSRIYGEERMKAIVRAGIVRPPVTLRARKGREILAEWLKARGIAFEAGPSPDAVLLWGAEAVAAEATAQGLAWVQDVTSQGVVPLLDLRPGQRVLDLCAAPGGKAVQIADRMGGGVLVACDVDARKVEALAALAPEMGQVRYEARLVEREGELPFVPGSFDRVLVDAPCSNTGVLRRRVEVRWRLRHEDVQTLASLQLDLLRRAFAVLASDGVLVYSTCSIEPEENEGVVDAFLAAEPRATAGSPLRHLPRAESDGGFAVALARRPD